MWCNRKSIPWISNSFILCGAQRAMCKHCPTSDHWKHGPASSTKLAITVTSATRADVHVVRELTFEDGKPGILPDLQRMRWRAPKGICTFQDNSLLKMASSRRTRCPGSFTKLMIKTKMGDRDVLSEDIITRVKGLYKMGAMDVTL